MLALERKYRRGAAHPMAKLTPQQVAAIRIAPLTVSNRALAKQWGISTMHAWRIRNGHRWASTIRSPRPETTLQGAARAHA